MFLPSGESPVSVLALGFKRSLSILRLLSAVILLCYLRELPWISIFPGQKDLKSRHNVPSYSVLLLCCLPGNPSLVDESHPSQVCVAGVRRKSAGNGGGRERELMGCAVSVGGMHSWAVLIETLGRNHTDKSKSRSNSMKSAQLETPNLGSGVQGPSRPHQSCCLQLQPEDVGHR